MNQLYGFILIQGTINGDQCVGVAKNQLLGRARDMFPRHECMFQQDLAPCHVPYTLKGKTDFTILNFISVQF